MLRSWLRVRAAASGGAASGAGCTALHRRQYQCDEQQPQHHQQQQRAYAATTEATDPAAAAAAAAAERRQKSSSSGAAAARAQREEGEGDTVDYGFRQVPRADKERLVGGVFSSVAARYDAMNDLMSGGMHRLWKSALVADLAPFSGMRHLDVAGGTGDVAFRVLRAVRAAEEQAAWGGVSASGTGGQAAAAAAAGGGGGGAAGGVGGAAAATGTTTTTTTKEERARGSVVVCDINPDMLAVGRARAAAEPDLARDCGLEWVEGNAERLPFPDASFDAYTVAFGIRNVTDRPAALREARRVLAPGGRLLVLELCPPRALSQAPAPASYVPGAGAALEAAYDAYSLGAIPRIGAAVAGDSASYKYLVESVRRFPSPDEFAALVAGAGFCGVSYRLLSAGIVAIHSGFKL